MGKQKPLIEPATAESMVAKRGTTTTNGAGDGSTVIDASLTEANDYWNDMTLLILSGASDGQSRDITDFAGGTLTVSPVFANQILSGVRYFILPFKPSAAEVEDIKGTGFVKDTDSLVDLAHAGEYDTQLDANMSTRAPASEYDTEMARITANVATEAKQDVIDGFHDVPVEDVATDSQMRDVVGKKSDTIAGTSIVAISKQVKAKTDNIPASPAPSGEYDTELDANMSTRAPASEYDTEMARITADVATEAKQDIIDGVVDDIKAETDQLPNWQSETEWSSTPTIQALADATATALTAGSITPTYPTGATRVRAILIATIHCANKTAVAHHIKFKIEGQKAAGGYGDLLNLTAQEGLSMVDVDGATDGWSGAIDVTALVDTSGAAYDFRFEVDSDNAGNVIYICSFVLALVYTM